MITEALKIFEPRPFVRTIDWAKKHGWNEDGKPYNDLLYPHLSAPGGPFDAFDSQQYFDIWLQWASRLGKTFGGQIITLKQAACDPCPMMFASSNEELAVGVVERTYSMINYCAPLRPLMLPPNRRRQSRISLRMSRVYVAWSRSVSSLADKNIKVGHASEIDKWEHQTTSKEADPLKLFDDRFKDFPFYKRWKEGTPSIKGRSRIESGRLQSSNCRLYVPCPHCKQYQPLSMDGLAWDKNSTGRSDKSFAQSTARYACSFCEEHISDEHRGSMMRLGVWIPEGCGCNQDEARNAAMEWRTEGRSRWGGWDDSPWITGTPSRGGRDYGSQLSSLYALSRTWGDIAAEFVGCKEKPQNLRNFINQWLAETWEVQQRQQTWEELGTRLIGKVPAAVVPDGMSLLTAGVDKQESHFVYVVTAWGQERKTSTIAYGTADTAEELMRVLATKFRHEDNGTGLPVTLSLIDSGYKPHGVGDMCLRFKGPGKLVPCKGSTTSLNAPFRVTVQGKDSATPNMNLVWIDTMQSQDWLETMLHGNDKLKTLHHGTNDSHQDYLEQLLNDAAVTDLDPKNNARLTWNRIDESMPNDFRDCERYAWVAMLISTRGGSPPVRAKTVPRQPNEPEQKPERFIQRPGGWIQRR